MRLSNVVMQYFWTSWLRILSLSQKIVYLRVGVGLPSSNVIDNDANYRN